MNKAKFSKENNSAIKAIKAKQDKKAKLAKEIILSVAFPNKDMFKNI
jgi:hypothetical protein